MAPVPRTSGRSRSGLPGFNERVLEVTNGYWRTRDDMTDIRVIDDTASAIEA